MLTARSKLVQLHDVKNIKMFIFHYFAMCRSSLEFEFDSNTRKCIQVSPKLLDAGRTECQMKTTFDLCSSFRSW